MTLAIDIKGLKKTYKTATGGKHEALKGVDLEIESNELFGFVGVNGAGKSTLIKSLVGLLRPSGGDSKIFGFTAGTTEARKMLGYLPEVSTFHEFLSAQELLSIHAALAGVPAKERTARCAEVLKLVGLGARMKNRLSEFSKGMKQRFGIAQAMVGNPRLLILDELTSGLDPLAQLELKDIMLKLRENGTTIFFSSHHMAEVEAVCDRVAILHRGRLRALGKLSDLLTKPDLMQLRLRLAEGARSELVGRLPGGIEKAVLDSGELSLTVPRAEVAAILEFVRENQGELLFLSPFQITLEQFYFKTVQDADAEDGVVL